jgi:hypothetical protein
VRKALGSAGTGNSALSYLELAEGAAITPPPYRFGPENGASPQDNNNGFAAINLGNSATAFTGKFLLSNGVLNLKSIVQTNIAPGCPGLIAPSVLGGATVLTESNNAEGVVGVIAGIATDCEGGGFAPVQGLYRFFGPRLGAQEFTKFKEFFNATFPTLQVHALSPNEGNTFDIGLPTSLLGCNGPTVDSDIAWRSSLVSPVTGTNAV